MPQDKENIQQVEFDVRIFEPVVDALWSLLWLICDSGRDDSEQIEKLVGAFHGIASSFPGLPVEHIYGGDDYDVQLGETLCHLLNLVRGCQKNESEKAARIATAFRMLASCFSTEILCNALEGYREMHPGVISKE